MSQKVLGLDIQSNAVSAVLVSSGLRRLRLEDWAHIELNDQPDFRSKIASAIENVQKEMSFRGALCVASFPAEHIFYRNIQVPFKEPKKIAKILPFELEPNMPFPIEELIFDFFNFNGFESPGNADILAVIVEKSKLEAYLDTFASFDMEPEIISAGAYAAARYVAGLPDSPPNALILDIAQRQCSLFLMASRQICYARTIPLRFRTALQKSRLCTEINHTLMAFNEMYRIDFKPENVILTGYDNAVAGFETELRSRLNLSTARADLVHATRSLVSGLDTIPWKSGQMNNALALALMNIKGIKGTNLRKYAFSKKNIWHEHKTGIIKTSILAGVVLALFLVTIAIDSFFLKKHVRSLNQQIETIFSATFPEVKRIVDPLQQMRVKLKELDKNADSNKISGMSVLKVDILKAISEQIPDNLDIEITGLVMGPERITISGFTDRFNTVNDVKTQLQQIDFFKGVKIDSAKIDKTQNRVRFKLNVEL